MNTYSDDFDLRSLERIQPDLIETSFDNEEVQIGFHLLAKIKIFKKIAICFYLLETKKSNLLSILRRKNLELFIEKLDEQEKEEKFLNEMVFSDHNFRTVIQKVKHFKMKIIPYIMSQNLQFLLALINFILLMVFLYAKKDEY